MKTVVRLFKHFDDAERSMIDLSRLGFTEQQVALLAPTVSNPPAGRFHMRTLDLPGVGSVAANDQMLKLLDGMRPDGFVGALAALGISKTEAQGYVDGLRRGETIEAITIDDAKEADARAILRANDHDVVIPIVEEELRVGKRELDAGGVRIATHVAKRPIDKTITIREEHVVVEHRILDRNAECADDAFRDRAVEMTATDEEPVVTKRARVVEEIRVHKDSTEHIETIHDTLRHTEVDVEELPGERNPSK